MTIEKMVQKLCNIIDPTKEGECFYFQSKDYRKNIDYLKIKAKIEKENEFIEEIKRIIWNLLSIFLNS